MPKAEHTGLGTASLVLGIIAIVFSVQIFTWSRTIFSNIPISIFGILALVFGAVSYWGKSRDNFGLVGFILGLISIIITAVTWGLVIFTLD